MISRRDHSRAAPQLPACVHEGARFPACALQGELRRLGVALSLAALVSVAGCAQESVGGPGGPSRRALLAALVPKLDLRWQLERVRGRDDEVGARVGAGFAAFLRWQPSSYAAEVPRRFELSPAAWVSACELDDVTCFAELAESDGELAEALREER